MFVIISLKYFKKGESFESEMFQNEYFILITLIIHIRNAIQTGAPEILMCVTVF